MKRRGKRLAFTVAATGLAVVLVLGVAHWGTIRDHVEAWHFQLTMETWRIEPNPAWEAQPLDARRGFQKLTREELVMFEQDVQTYFVGAESLLQVLANSSDCPVILCPAASSLSGSAKWMLTPAWMESASADAVLFLLRSDGWRVLEQRFPRRAYVVMRGEHCTSHPTGEGCSAGIMLPLTPAR